MASRKEQKARLRAERLARERTAAAAARRKRLVGRLVAAVIAGAMVAAIVAVIATGVSDDGGGSGSFPAGTVPPERVSDLDEAAEEASCSVEDFESAGAKHVEDKVEYASLPPHSGNHAPMPIEDGAYAESVEPEPVVHSLEHGRVVFWFKPDVAPRVKGALKALYDEDPYHVVLVPDSRGMSFEVAASAWTHVAGCPEANESVYDVLRAFKTKYRDKGPEFVP